MRKLRIGVYVSAATLVLATGLVTSPAAGADSGRDDDAMRVRMLDNCDATTFNAAFGPGTCVGDGDTPLGRFLAQLGAKGSANGWKFTPRRFHAARGERLRVVNRGGEFHTFTEVAHFGGGCIAPLNAILGLTPVPECAPLLPDGTPVVFATTGAAAGGHLNVTRLRPGIHKFECMIHPWMHSTVVVRAHHHH